MGIVDFFKTRPKKMLFEDKHLNIVFNLLVKLEERLSAFELMMQSLGGDERTAKEYWEKERNDFNLYSNRSQKLLLKILKEKVYFDSDSKKVTNLFLSTLNLNLPKNYSSENLNVKIDNLQNYINFLKKNSKKINDFLVDENIEDAA